MNNFCITIDLEDGDLIIAEEGCSGCRYNVKTEQDIIDALRSYLLERK